MMNGASRISQYSSSVPRPELGGSRGHRLHAVRAELLAELRAVGWPGMTVVYDFPLVSSPMAGVFEPLEPLSNVTVLILWALASEMNCE